MELSNIEGLKVFERQLVLFIVAAIFFFIGVTIGYKANEEPTPPVEEMVKVDSIIKVNDSIKIKIEQLDSVKNAKIIEVQSLDKDSTVKLFYKLINK